MRIRIHGTKTCEQCETEFERGPRISTKVWNTKRFCGLECARASRLSTVNEKVCGRCGVTFKRKTRDGGASWRRRAYCGIRCSQVGRPLARSTRYRRIGRKLPAHRVTMEATLGRSLMPGEVVHHIDGNKLNNDPANLVVMSAHDHARLHQSEDAVAFRVLADRAGLLS